MYCGKPLSYIPYPVSFIMIQSDSKSVHFQLRNTKQAQSFFDLRNRSTVTLPTELQGRTEKVGDDLDGKSRRRESKGTYECCAA